MRRLWWIILACTLFACEGDESSQPPPVSPTYHVDYIDPRVQEAGGRIRIYGQFPKDAQVSVEGKGVTIQRYPAYLEVKLPESLWAGSHVVVINSPSLLEKGPLKSTFSIMPYIAEGIVDQEKLVVAGSGWLLEGQLAPKTEIEIDTQKVSANLVGKTLVAPLPKRPFYGDLSVRVWVDGISSAFYSVPYRAGTLKGRVSTKAPEGGQLNVAATLRTQASFESQTASQMVVSVGSPVHHLQDRFLSMPGIETVQFIPNLGVFKLRFVSHAAGLDATSRFAQWPEVRFWEWDLPVHMDGDVLQQIPFTEDADSQWFWPLLHVPEVWAKTQGEGIVVAAIDTGVMAHHPDLRANLLPGFDFIERDAFPQDEAGHGTHVAGLMVANGQVKGAAPQAKLVPIRALGPGGGDTSTVAEAVLWAAGLGVDPPNPYPASVINLSLGSNTYSRVLEDAIRRVQEKGVVVVAATGNSGGSLSYPAAFPGVLAVTAAAGFESPYQPRYANHGLGTQLAAYGGDATDKNRDGKPDGILSTDRGALGEPTYALRMGTSMAAPQVSGMLALALSSGISPRNAVDFLKHTARDLGVSGYDSEWGFGLVSGAFIGSPSHSTYVLLLKDREIVGWTVADGEGRYILHNVPPEQELTLLAVQDLNGDRRLNEVGEMRSDEKTIRVVSGETRADADLSLDPLLDHRSYVLP